MLGQIVDASLFAAPRQRNTDDEKKAINGGRIPANWKAKPAKLRHKDRDARWTFKFSKAKPREDGSTPPVDLAIPLFRYQNQSRSIAEQKHRMGLFIRTMAIGRATTKIGMVNLVYNIKRLIFLRKIAIA